MIENLVKIIIVGLAVYVGVYCARLSYEAQAERNKQCISTK